MAKDVFGSKDSIGEVQIASDVVSAIAGISAAEVDGVQSISGGGINDIAGKLGMKNYSKGVRVTIAGEKAAVEISVTLKYGYSIPEVSEKVQEKVSQAIKSMTGLEVEKVNVRIAGIALEEQA
ncbi:MAG: Asp23/Gls24 family envelope stress response protein [Eubacterium sp.]|nr:Asp23/Gls24 family envelope stress response protein [Eubacterium sp.]MDD5994753.1 Asp23/Gls24 family envelope stress response protein [Clostridiales bacterium]MDY3774134.1 Asp23/Gls24 family envelope stress response protein [Eubacterium sp.]